MPKEETKSDIFLYLALFCLGINYILYNALGIYQFKTVLRVSGIALMLVKLIMSGKWRFTFMQCVLVTVSVIALLINGSESINLIALVILGISMDIDETGAYKAYKVNFVLVLIVLVFLVTGVMQNRIWYGGTDIIRKTRWTLGFGNPNHAAAFFTSFFCLYVITREHINKWHIIVLIFLESGVYYYTNSRTWFIAYIIFSLILLIMLYTDKMQNVLQTSCIVVTDVFFGVHLFLQYIIDFIMRFDMLLSFRISRFKAVLAHFGLKEYLIGGGIVSVDSMYINLLYVYGIFVYLIVWLAVHISMINLRKENNYKMLAFLVVMLIVGLMESSTIRPEFMSSIILWTVILYNCQP